MYTACGQIGGGGKGTTVLQGGGVNPISTQEGKIYIEEGQLDGGKPHRTQKEISTKGEKESRESL